MDIGKLAAKIKRCGAKKILLQLPEGLKMGALELVKELEKYGIRTLLSTETCYGACDLRDNEAKDLGCDLLVHVGHSDMGLKTKLPVIYEEYRIDLDLVPLLKKNSSFLKSYKKICLVTTIQFIDKLKPAKMYLESKAGGGKKISIGSPSRAKYPGQILGCDYSAAEPFDKIVDCFLYVGSGFFHPLGLAMKVVKPVLFLDVETGKIKDLEKEKTKQEIIKTANIHRARECWNFGILVSSKQGQMQIKTAETTKKKLQIKNKNACIVVMDEINPNKLIGLKFDCLVNCACPRLSDDIGQFKKPIINPNDVDKI